MPEGYQERAVEPTAAKAESAGSIRNGNAWLFPLPALLLFAQGALTQLDLPGVYLDAINPDYIVLGLLATAKNTPVWLLPGNLLFDRFPVLIQIYHGALPFYFGLPVYLLFGTGMVGIRLANLSFGLLVLGAFAVAMRRLQMNAAVAGLALAALALDPGFLFAFRTQFYITTLPMALVFASLAVSREGASHRRLVGAGALAGLAVYGYFCLLFVAPALACRIWRMAAAGQRGPELRAWMLGAALGVSPFALGLVLVARETGFPSGFFAFFAQYFGDLTITRSMSLAERLRYGADMLVATTRAIGPMSMMTGGMRNYAPLLKSVLLMGGPSAALLVSLWPHAPWQAAQTAALGMLGLIALYLVFGDRAWLHHAAPALPLMYLGLAALGDQAVQRWRGRLALALAATPLIALLWINAIDRRNAQLALERTGGVSFFSDAFTHFEQDAARTPRLTRAFFPDWGLILPFAMLTGGAIPVANEFRPDAARQTLCSGRDALLAVLADKPPERLTAWILATDWPAPETTVYSGRDGAPAVVAVRWKASDKPAKPCT